MKKLSFLLVVLVVLGGYFYFYFSAPKVLERRLDSLLATLSFGAVSLTDTDKVANKFASHFADEIVFSGAGNDIITGSVTPDDMKTLYSEQFRAATRKSQAKTTGDLTIQLKAPDRAEMAATIQLDLVLRDNVAYPRTIPAQFVWNKIGGKWVISEVQLLESPDGFGF